MKRLLFIMTLPLIFSCHRYVYNSSGDCVGALPPYVGLNIHKSFVDPKDTSKILVQYKYVKGWSWDQVEISHDSGFYYLNTSASDLPGLRVKWKADTLTLWGYNYIANDTTLWPGTLLGTVQLIDTAGLVVPITRKYYALAVAFYRINRCPEPYTEIFIHQTIDTGSYKGCELNINIQGPLKSFNK